MVRMKGTPDAYCLYILLIRLDATRWITASPVLNVTVDDVTGEEMTLVGRNAPLPLEGRPFLVHDRLDRVDLRALWARAFILAEIHGAAAPPPPLTGPAGWFCADTTQATCGMEVPAARVADPTLAKLAASVGILRLEDGNWVHLERVMRSDVAAWRVAKSVGAGRDLRPTAAAEPAARGPRPIYRDVMSGSGVPTVMPNARVFDGLDHLRHAAVSAVGAHTSGLDQHTSELQEAGSQNLQQHRLQREENEHDSKKKKNDKAPKGGGKGDDP